MIVKPSITRYKYTLDSANGDVSKQLSTSGGNELVSVVVTGGSADIIASVHDSKNGVVGGIPSDIQYFASNQGESRQFSPNQPILMKNGIFVQIEQGGGAFNGKVTVYYN